MHWGPADPYGIAYPRNSRWKLKADWQRPVWLWKQRLANPQSGLPEGATGEISSDGAVDPTFTITLAWEENDAAQAIQLQVQP